MQLCRCPVCHARIGLEALVMDAAASELLALVARLDAPLATALVQYLGLFKSATRDLDHARAVRLAREVLALADGAALTTALAETVDAIRAKRERGDVRPLANHNYLKQVIGSVSVARVERPPAAGGTDMVVHQSRVAGRSKMVQGLAALEAMKGGNRNEP